MKISDIITNRFHELRSMLLHPNVLSRLPQSPENKFLVLYAKNFPYQISQFYITL